MYGGAFPGGAVPLGMEVREGGDSGVPVVIGEPNSPQAKAFRHVAEEVARQVSIEAMKPELVVLANSVRLGSGLGLALYWSLYLPQSCSVSGSRSWEPGARQVEFSSEI
jgi:hypothetical protein